MADLFPGVDQRRQAAYLLPWGVLVLTLLATLLAWNTTRETVNQNQRNYFDFRAREAISRIEHRMQAYVQVLLGVRGLYEVSGYLDRNQFRTYVASLHLADNYPGIQGVGFSLIVPAAERDKHLSGIRKQGFSEYSIRPDGWRDPYTSIIYLEPFSNRNLRAFGYDMYAEPVRREAMERARDTGDAVMSGKVRLVQESGKNEQAGFLIFVPVYKQGLSHSTEAERRKNIIGWAYSPFRMDDLMGGINADQPKDIDLEIFDGKEPVKERLMYDAVKLTSGMPQHGSLQSGKVIEIAGHAWTVNIRALPSIDNYLDKNRPTMVGAMGLVLSLMTTLLVWMLVTGRERALGTAREMNRELIEAKAKLTGTLDAIPDLLFEVGLDGRYYDLHASHPELLAAEPDVLIGKRINEILPPEASAVCMEALQEANEKGTSFGRQFSLMLDQEPKWFELSVAKKEGNQGDVSQFIMLSRDITARKIAEEKLKTSEAGLIEAQHLAHIGSWEWDILANTALWSDETYWIFDIPPHRLEDHRQNFLDKVHRDDRDRVNQALSDALEGIREYDIEYRIFLQDGTEKFIHALGKVTRNGKGEPILIRGTVQDITERRKMSEELELFRLMVEKSGDPIFMIDDDDGCRMMYVNEAAIEHYGAPREKILTWRIPDWDPNFSYATLSLHVEEVKKIRNLTIESLHRIKGGAAIAPVEITLNYLFYRGRNCHFGYFRDISERKKYMEGLRRAQQLAEENAAAKSSFLANMSHEIRTPMNAIIGLSQLALNKSISTEVRDYLEKIFKSSNSLLRILNDILDISKIEAGGITIEYAGFDLDVLLKNLDTLFRSYAEDKYLEFGIEVPPDVPRNLVGDAFRLQQVLSNLLGNAIKFTEHGKVALKVVFKESSKERATLRFSVEDTGIGIAKEDISRLFNPFSQVDGSITRRFGGTGLGLAISHDLLQLMGGNLDVESMPGKGTTFSFELTFDRFGMLPSPVASHPGEQDATLGKLHEHGYPLAGAHVLVVEDDFINQQVVREFLELSGVTVTLAGNGKEALETLDKDVFDAVLMDVHMPVMDGTEAVRQIRAQPRFADLPVIALTADIASENCERYLACGMNELLSKPILPEHMIAVLARLLGHKETKGE